MLTTSERTEPFANILDISCCSYVHNRHHNVNYFFIYNQFLFHNANIVKKIEKVKKKLKNFNKISFFDSSPYHMFNSEHFCHHKLSASLAPLAFMTAH